MLVVRDFCFAIPVSGVQFRYSCFGIPGRLVPGSPVLRPGVKACKYLHRVCKLIANENSMECKRCCFVDMVSAGSEIQQAVFSNFIGIFTNFLSILRKFSNFVQFRKQICENVRFFTIPARQHTCSGTKGQTGQDAQGCHLKKRPLIFSLENLTCLLKRTTSLPSGSHQGEGSSWKRLVFRAAERVISCKKPCLYSLCQRKTG